MPEGRLPAVGADPDETRSTTPTTEDEAVAPTVDAPPEPADPAGDRPVGRRTTRWRGGTRLSTGHEIYWWVEVGIVLVFDLIYETLRDLNSAGTAHAFHNATRLIGWERWLHIYAERDWQRFALAHAKWAVIGANYYYGAVYICCSRSARSSSCTAASPTTTRCGATPWRSARCSA